MDASFDQLLRTVELLKLRNIKLTALLLSCREKLHEDSRRLAALVQGSDAGLSAVQQLAASRSSLLAAAKASQALTHSMMDYIAEVSGGGSSGGADAAQEGGDAADSAANTAVMQHAMKKFRSVSGEKPENGFCGFETSPAPGGSDVFVKGTCFEQFAEAWQREEEYPYESLGEDSYVKSVPADAIEGIRLGRSEFENPGHFWREHEAEGTAESFLEISRHIPVVSMQLEAGCSLSELEADPVLGRCARLYFDVANIPRVTDCGEYYEAEGSGRHRILAARALGFEIPVLVVGERKRSKTLRR